MSSASYTPAHSTPFSQPTYTRLYNVVNTNTRKILDNVGKLNNLMSNGLSSCNSNSPEWEKFKSLLVMTKQVANNTADHVKKLRAMFLDTGVTDHLPEKNQTEQLTTDFEKALTSFNYYQKEATTIERRLIAETKMKYMQQGEGGDGDHTQGLTQEQQQLLINKTDINELNQREANLLNMEESVMDINQIFKDLAVLIADQGEVIDRIEDHITQTAVRIETGNENLHAAVENQKSSRKKKVICLIIVVIVLLILAIVIAVSFT